MTSEAATAILAARQARRVPLPLGTAAPADIAAGYAAQREVAAALGAVPPAGFKIGATTKQMQAYLGLAGPAAGFVQGENLQVEAERFRFADLSAPGVECEVGAASWRGPARRPLHARGCCRGGRRCLRRD
jgi:2-keto-4-pentenoate hydratase